ncbi:MAG: hypothetical protein HY721_26810, partial [Planctomycetes bacterium]|nr:hypothetical protein [Planctomycetota bacterium]
MRGKAPASPLSRCALGLALGAAFAGCAGGGPAAAGAPSRRGALRLAGAGDGARATVFEVKADDAASPAAIDALRLAPGRAREPLYL